MNLCYGPGIWESSLGSYAQNNSYIHFLLMNLNCYAYLHRLPTKVWWDTNLFQSGEHHRHICICAKDKIFCPMSAITVLLTLILHWPYLIYCNEEGPATRVEALGLGKFSYLKYGEMFLFSFLSLEYAKYFFVIYVY